MKNHLVLVLVLMVGLVIANDNSTAPDGFVPKITNFADSRIPIAQVTVDDNTNGENNSCASTVPGVSSGTDAFTFTEVNWSSVSWLGAGNALRGLDIVTHGGYERVMSPRDSLYVLNLDDGTKVDAFPLDPNNAAGFGCYPYASVNVNDWSDTVIYNSTDLGVNWTANGNPAGDDGRGMDADYSASLVWETNSGTGVYSFSHLSASGTFYDLSADIPGQMSGLTTYDHDGNHFLIVNTYNTNYAYFFDLDNSLNFIGTAEYPYPSAFSKSYGLTYSSSRDTFFWSFKNSGNNCFLIELQLTMTSLEQSTWADIKSSF